MPLVCPWWLGPVIDNRLRRWIQNPEIFLAPFVREGMTILDIGCGMGFTAIPAARFTGPSGRVIAVDIQQRMLNGLVRRATRAGMQHRIEPYCARPDDLGQHGPADLAIAFFCIHETQDIPRTLHQIRASLKPGAGFFLAEPLREVPEPAFQATLNHAVAEGFSIEEPVDIRFARAAFLKAGSAPTQTATGHS